VEQFPSFPDLPEDEEAAAPLSFDAEDVPLPIADEAALSEWINRVAAQHGCVVSQVQYVFCSDDYLHQINLEYLNHDTLTDIITFPYGEQPELAGDIFISVDRVRDNAHDLGLPFEQELHRVVIHGILHLCGFGDETDEEEAAMRRLEEEALAMKDDATTAK
jgi:rRNA maturation RNase YbeY